MGGWKPEKERRNRGEGSLGCWSGWGRRRGEDRVIRRGDWELEIDERKRERVRVRVSGGPVMGEVWVLRGLPAWPSVLVAPGL